jgi:hypothetical protein
VAAIRWRGLEKVKARADSAREQNRAELLPLLKSAQLQADRNHPEEAERLFGEILDLEPAWPEARNALAGFLIQRGEVSEPAQGNAKLREAEARGIELWDDELNRVYQLLQPKLSEPDRAKLRDAPAGVANLP